MIKKLATFLTVLLVLNTANIAKEGMWLPLLLKSLNESDDETDASIESEFRTALEAELDNMIRAGVFNGCNNIDNDQADEFSAFGATPDE